MPTRIDQFRVHGPPGPSSLESTPMCKQREADAITGDVRLLDEAGRVAVEILGLRFEYLGDDTQRAAETRISTIGSMSSSGNPKSARQDKSWNLPSPASRGSWLIFTDSGGVGDALAALLEAQGERSILVTRGESYEQTDGEHFRIRPEQPEDIRRLFEAALASDQPVCRGIVHLWSLDARFSRGDDRGLAECRPDSGLRQCLAVGPGAGSSGIGRPPSPVADHAGRSSGRRRARAPGRRSVAALGIGSRHCSGTPDVLGRAGGPGTQRHRCVTLPLSQLWEEISTPDGEDQLAFRQGRRYVARLVRKRPSATQDLLSAGGRTAAI